MQIEIVFLLLSGDGDTFFVDLSGRIYKYGFVNVLVRMFSSEDVF